MPASMMLASGPGVRLGSPCPALASSSSSMGGRHGIQPSILPGRVTAGRPNLAVHAAKRDEGVSSQKVKDGGGFRFDAFKNSWVRDNRIMTATQAGEEFKPTIQPKSGGAYTVWPVVYTELMERGLKSISPAEAQKRQKRGKAVIVDVRLAKDFAVEHVSGAVSVPLFRVTEGKELWDNIKRVAFMGLNMTPTERDPDFAAKVEEAVGKRKEIILMCSLGGSMSRTVSGSTMGRSADKVKKFEDPERSFGRESRSLKACYELYQAGFKNITHMEGGLPSWRVADLGTEGS